MPKLADILSDTNLYNAWIKVQGNDGCAGIDNVILTDFSSKAGNLQISTNSRYDIDRNATGIFTSRDHAWTVYYRVKGIIMA